MASLKDQNPLGSHHSMAPSSRPSSDTRAVSPRACSETRPARAERCTRCQGHADASASQIRSRTEHHSRCPASCRPNRRSDTVPNGSGERVAPARQMVNDLVNALPELRILVGEELYADADIARLPRSSAVVGAIHTRSRDGDQHPVRVGRVQYYSM